MSKNITSYASGACGLFAAIVVLAVVAAFFWITQGEWRSDAATAPIGASEQVLHFYGQRCDASSSNGFVEAGRPIIVARPDHAAINVELVPASTSGRGTAVILIRLDGSSSQVLAVDQAQSFQVCDLNGDGEPDLLVDAGAGGHVVNHRAYVYASPRSRFVALEYDGDFNAISNLFVQVDVPLDPDAVLDNVEDQSVAGYTILKQSMWQAPGQGGITSCWTLRGHRLALLAILRQLPGEGPRAYWDVDSRLTGLRVHTMEVSEQQWQDEDGDTEGLGELSCPEILALLPEKPGTVLHIAPDGDAQEEDEEPAMFKVRLVRVAHAHGQRARAGAAAARRMGL